MIWIPFDPRVLGDAEARKTVRACARTLSSATLLTAQVITELRAECGRRCGGLPPEVAPVASLCCSILCDLRAQGWALRVQGRRIEMAPPRPEVVSVETRKAQVRAAHLIERDAQLLLPPTRRFIREMERRRLHGGSWCSIFSLMRDGRDLAFRLQRAAEAPLGLARTKVLRACVDPYIHVVGPNDVCPFTGLRLFDVWRYFRHTWTTPYFSTPGRKVWFLVRDRAAPNHAVIGIGALGSAVVQLAPRDQWIGWTWPQFLEKLIAEPTTRWARWLERSLARLIDGIYVKDLLSESVITRAALRHPAVDDIARLRDLAVAERRLHRLYPMRQLHKTAASGAATAHWEVLARTHLFRAKRAGTLADLLEARRRFLAVGFAKPTAAALKRALRNTTSHRGIRTVLRYVKGAHVGVAMMDITICGAVAPYNALLGGKLVALLMAGPEVVATYAKRYKSAVSVIASAMAGRAIRRRPNLVLLGTTSLYDVAPAQYNRLRMPARFAGGRDADELAFIPLGRTVGFGSYHFSRETMATLELVLARREGGRPVNSIFGEGVNPKLRKVRTALDLVGMVSDALLQHRSRRVIYGVPLASNFREVLIGLAAHPRLIVPRDPAATTAIVDFWRERWLSRRIERRETIAAVATHALAYPVRHGARVVLPLTSEEEGPLFAVASLAERAPEQQRTGIREPTHTSAEVGMGASPASA